MSDTAAWIWAQVLKLVASAALGGIVFAITGTLTFWAWFGIAALVVFFGVWLVVFANDSVD